VLPPQIDFNREAIAAACCFAVVSADTVAHLDRGEALKDRTVDAIRTALESAGVEFIAKNGGGAGARLRNTISRESGDAE